MSKQERKSAAKSIADSAHQIWLAGLGAFAKAQAEGSRMFEQLIREGTELDEKTRKYTKTQLGKLRETMEQSTERLLSTSRSTMDRVQGLIDRRVAEAVERLAVPTREELSRLADQLEQLGERLDASTAKKAPPAEARRGSGAASGAASGTQKRRSTSSASGAAKKSTTRATKSTARKSTRKP